MNCNAWGLRICTGARISFTLIDLNGSTGRRNGMASLYLGDPGFQASVFPSPEINISLDSESQGYHDVIDEALTKVQSRWNLPGVALRVEKGLPAHSGCGSKTTTLLAIAKVYGALFGKDIDVDEIALITGRAGTSGGSINLFERGGFLVDGGHANPEEFAKDPNRFLLPSRYATAARKPPVLINLPFPQWPVLLIETHGSKLHSEEELEWFRKHVPIPIEAAQATAHHVLLNLATSVAEHDYQRFCTAINTITYDHYFKGRQIAMQPTPVQEMLNDARNRTCIDAIALSVTGPLCFGFTRDPMSAMRWCEQQRALGAVSSYRFSYARNRPYEITATVDGEPR